MRIVTAVAAIGMMLTACSGSPTEPSPTPAAIALDASAWQTISEPQPFPLANQGNALSFEFPQAGSIQYLFAPSPVPAIHGTLVASFSITTNGPATFNSLDPQSASCAIASSVRPFIWANDNASGAYDRWWSNPRAFALTSGTATLSVPLRPENWSSVNGKFGNADPETRFRFEKALLNMSRVGLTFGGGCSFGHGINVSGGTATFLLTEFAIR